MVADEGDITGPVARPPRLGKKFPRGCFGSRGSAEEHHVGLHPKEPPHAEGRRESVTQWVGDLKAGDRGEATRRLWERYFPRLTRLAQARLRATGRGPVDGENAPGSVRPSRSTWRASPVTFSPPSPIRPRRSWQPGVAHPSRVPVKRPPAGIRRLNPLPSEPGFLARKDHREPFSAAGFRPVEIGARGERGGSAGSNGARLDVRG
jgi:hypothetical protein